MATTYSSYLHLEELLSLQKPESPGPEHDEMLFIVIHQTYELWFKQLLHELDFLAARLRAADLPRALGTLRRMLTILKTVVAQVDVLETMTPLEFNAFRDALDTASGFQSAQFRALEFALGYKRKAMLKHYEGPLREALEARFDAPTLWDAFLHLLNLGGYGVPATLLERDVREAVTPSDEVQRILIDIYRHNPDLSRVCERMVDFDEGMQEWRYRHVKMVERTIGAKMGTGGSAGSSYLMTTLKPLFPDLWAIRSEL